MKLTEKQLEDLAKRNLANFGPSKDMFIHGYGQVLKDGKPTVAGIKWAEDFKGNKYYPKKMFTWKETEV